MNLIKYLKYLQEDENETNESIFPMDSFHTSKKPLNIKAQYSLNENNDDYPEIIMIDFDKTIHKYSEGWKDGKIYDEPFGGVKEIINELKKQGYKIFIFTSRLSKTTHGDNGVKLQKQMIKEWLNKYNIKVDGMTAEKIPAKIYIDDLAINFDGQWDKEFYREINKKLNIN